MATFRAIWPKRSQHTFGKLANCPIACFVVVVSQAIIVLHWLCESKFKSIPYIQHQLINVCTNIQVGYVMALVLKYFDIIGPCNFKHLFLHVQQHQVRLTDDITAGGGGGTFVGILTCMPKLMMHDCASNRSMGSLVLSPPYVVLFDA